MGKAVVFFSFLSDLVLVAWRVFCPWRWVWVEHSCASRRCSLVFLGGLWRKGAWWECGKGQPCLSETPVKRSPECLATSLVLLNWKSLWLLGAWKWDEMPLRALSSPRIWETCPTISMCPCWLLSWGCPWVLKVEGQEKRVVYFHF